MSDIHMILFFDPDFFLLLEILSRQQRIGSLAASTVGCAVKLDIHALVTVAGLSHMDPDP